MLKEEKIFLLKLLMSASNAYSSITRVSHVIPEIVTVKIIRNVIARLKLLILAFNYDGCWSAYHFASAL